MKEKTLRGIIIALLVLVTNVFTKELFNPNEIYFSFDNPGRAALGKLTFLISLDGVENGKVYAYANKKEFAKFKDFGLNFEILPNPSLAKDEKALTMATTLEQMESWDRYPTWEVYVEMLEKFASDYPSICRLRTIGTSKKGRDLYDLVISDNVNTAEKEPEVLYSSQMHGDEVVDYVTYLHLADYLLSNYGSDPQVTTLIDNIELHIHPLTNPDGTYASGNHTISGATRYNGNSIDLNRNYKDHIYGDHPDGNAYQPETLAQMADATSRNYIFSNNTHSGIELVNYPWDNISERHADNDWWLYISNKYADTVHANSPSGYFTGQGNGVTNGNDWYEAPGCRQDYMNYYHNCRELTLELSDDKLLDAALLDDHFEYNKQALLDYLNTALYGIKGVVESDTGTPLHAKIEVLNHDKHNTFIYSDKDLGNYVRMIAPGTYDLQFSADGYATKTIENVVVNSYEDVVVLNVVLNELGAPEVLTVEGRTTAVDTEMNISVNLESAHSLDWARAIYNVNNVTDSVSLSSSKLQTVLTGTLPAQNSEISGSVFIRVADVEGNVSKSEDYPINWLNLFVESFENGFADNDWTFTGNSDWISSNTAYEGNKSVKSGSIVANQSSSLKLTLDFETDGSISFYRKVSSEAPGSSFYDGLQFYLDGSLKSQTGGESDWTLEEHNVTAGRHIFEWKYVKDSMVDDGQDCAWIDYFTAIGVSQSEDIESPSCSFISLSNNDQIINNGIYKIEINALDNVAIDKVEVYEDDSLLGNAVYDSDNKYILNWNVQDKDSGFYTITAKAIDTSGNYNSESVTIEIVSPSAIIAILPEKTYLYGNYPNPFNPATSMNFSLSRNCKVNLSVYNYQGELVKELLNSEMTPGNYSIKWNGKNNFGITVSSGVYFFKMTAGKYRNIVKGMLIK